ncbi:hypothetical protein [Zhihengliuella halotolerans]|uniref:Uncharacterized protein n=1 Tax=Zhihengliuella halotolerans TaxID=370736 RepID=A0A4Q8ACQ2_9MICC|nr:hypothetical protein [Zhihengliuella halotolerans]RZU61987.1 hypothetical protein EV380_1572 [Zhihengliuella halotolerans]
MKIKPALAAGAAISLAAAALVPAAALAMAPAEKADGAEVSAFCSNPGLSRYTPVPRPANKTVLPYESLDELNAAAAAAGLSPLDFAEREVDASAAARGGSLGASVHGVAAASLQDTIVWAEQEGLTLAEAHADMSLNKAAINLASALEVEHPDSVAFFRQNPESGSVSVGFAGAVTPEIRALLDESPVPVGIDENIGWTEDEIHHETSRALDCLSAATDDAHHVEGDQFNGVLEVTAEEGEQTFADREAAAALKALLATTNFEVRIVEGEAHGYEPAIFDASALDG